jgi:hypothetical protein
MADNFDRQYVEAEAELERQMTLAYQNSQNIQQHIRRQENLTDEQREQRYIERFTPIAENLDNAATAFVGFWENQRSELAKKVHEGTGERFADHVGRVSELPDEKLGEVMETAIRTGQDDLAQAAAEVALTRQGYSRIFNAWAERNPERAQALKRLHSLPDPERLVTRASARAQVPPASPEALKPRQEDLDFLQAQKTAKAAQERVDRTRKPLIRRVGSRVEVY